MKTLEALLGVIILLTGASQLYAQSRVATTSLVLQVQAEELLQVRNGSVVLKIRLAHGTTGRIWAANSCTSPSPESQVIVTSGTYTIPLNALTPVRSYSTPGAKQFCLMSSDGVLKDSRLVEIMGTVSGAAPQRSNPPYASGGFSIGVPDGWAVTTREGTTTWSNP